MRSEHRPETSVGAHAPLPVASWPPHPGSVRLDQIFCSLAAPGRRIRAPRRHECPARGLGRFRAHAVQAVGVRHPSSMSWTFHPFDLLSGVFFAVVVHLGMLWTRAADTPSCGGRGHGWSAFENRGGVPTPRGLPCASSATTVDAADAGDSMQVHRGEETRPRPDGWGAVRPRMDQCSATDRIFAW